MFEIFASQRSGITQALMLVAACGAIAGPVSVALAIDIVFQYDGAQSVNPSFDPQAIGLTIALQQVEALYEDVINDPYTLTLHYRWVSDPNFTTLADHQLMTKSNGREIEGRLRFYAYSGNPFDPRTWFIDTTPSDHSEYDMAQTLWRDLSSDNKSGRFHYGANIPDTYEVSYNGFAKPTAPPEAQQGYDLLTVAAHEVGHALGMNASSEAQSETSDGDFDFDPAFVNGRTLAARDIGDAAHLYGLQLMGSIINTHMRMLPAMTDIFSMAAVNNLVSLDLDRREFWGGTNWNTAGAWAGNRLPSSDDDVFIRDPDSGRLSLPVVMGLTNNGFANNLFVGESASVSTNAFRLLASGSTTIDGAFTLGGSSALIHVNPGGELETTNLTLVNGGKLEMFGGLADINGTLRLSDNNATIDGYGTVDVLTSLVNNGRINVSVGSALNFVGGAAVVWDLDGNAETGDLVAVSGNLSFANGSVSDAFNGSMTIGAGRTLSIGPAWTLGAGGTANFTGSGAVLAGGQVTLSGRINTTAGSATITAPLLVSGAPTVDVAAGATLNVMSPYMTAGGGMLTKSGGGSLAFSGPQSHAPGSQLLANAGLVVLSTDAGAGGANLAITSNASLNFASTQHLAALNVTGGRTQIVTGGSRVLVTSALSVDTTDALIDIWEHAVIVDYTGVTALPAIQNGIASAYNGGAWTGFGITSSLADATHGVGYGESGSLGISSFEGETVDATVVLVKFTFFGDANLDGQVDISDLGRLATAWQTYGSWVNGDFDYSGFIDISALGKLATNWQAGVGGPLGPSFDGALASVGLGAVSVPEPASVVLLAATLLLARRRRIASGE